MMSLILDFAKDVAEHLAPEGPVLEVGARLADDQRHLETVRSLFPGREYVGVDIQEGVNVDRVEDVHALTFADGSFRTIICLETLEHVAHPHQAMSEMHRVLAPGGLLAISAPAPFFAIHAHPWDFWRFTPEGFDKLLEPFPSRWVTGFGFEPMPEHVFGIGIKGDAPPPQLQDLPRMHRWVTNWGSDLPVDLGPIRMSTRGLVRLAAKESVTAARRKLRRLAKG